MGRQKLVPSELTSLAANLNQPAPRNVWLNQTAHTAQTLKISGRPNRAHRFPSQLALLLAPKLAMLVRANSHKVTCRCRRSCRSICARTPSMATNNYSAQRQQKQQQRLLRPERWLRTHEPSNTLRSRITWHAQNFPIT